MAVQTLKFRDTRPILEVVLRDPPPVGSAPGTLGPVHDLTGSTAWYLHVWLSDGTKLAARTMVKFGADVNGTLRYTWVTTDWDAGNLVVGPSLPLKPGTREHRIEYEVIGPSPARLTFPNGGYDTLRILPDIGEGP